MCCCLFNSFTTHLYLYRKIKNLQVNPFCVFTVVFLPYVSKYIKKKKKHLMSTCEMYVWIALLKFGKNNVLYTISERKTLYNDVSKATHETIFKVVLQ